jgi:hypothetical protein
MFHHKQAEHVTVGLFKDHEGQPLVTVDSINVGTVDYLEEMILKFRQQNPRPPQVFVFAPENIISRNGKVVRTLSELSEVLGNVEVTSATIGPGR